MLLNSCPLEHTSSVSWEKRKNVWSSICMVSKGKGLSFQSSCRGLWGRPRTEVICSFKLGEHKRRLFGICQSFDLRGMLLFCFNYSSVSLENETIHFASGNTAWHQYPLQKCSCTICLTKGHHLNFITVVEYKLMPILHSSWFHSNTDYLGTQPLIKKQSPSPSWSQMCHVTKFLPTEFEQKWRMQLSRHLCKGKLLGLVVVLFPFL